MHSTDDPILDKELRDYLLGDLPANDVERLDELSIVDDAVALRLGEVENDLMDAYVRGQLSGEMLQRFESHYLTTPRRRERVAVARALMLAQSRRRILPFRGKQAAREAGSTGGAGRPGTLPERHWRGAVAAALLLALGSALGWVILRSDRQPQTAAVSLPAQVRSATVTGPPQAQAPTSRPESEARTKPEARTPRIQPAIAGFLLLPQTRGAQQLATIPVAATQQAIPLRLKLESNDFSDYRVELRDLTVDRLVWTSPLLHSRKQGAEAIVSLSLPAHLARNGRYAAELSGEVKAGEREFLSSYVFATQSRP